MVLLKNIPLVHFSWRSKLLRMISPDSSATSPLPFPIYKKVKKFWQELIFVSLSLRAWRVPFLLSSSSWLTKKLIGWVIWDKSDENGKWKTGNFQNCMQILSLIRYCLCAKEPKTCVYRPFQEKCTIEQSENLIEPPHSSQKVMKAQ